jgi:integrase
VPEGDALAPLVDCNARALTPREGVGHRLCDAPRRRARSHREAIDEEQRRRVLEAIPEPRRGIFLALAFHGLRPSDAARLDVADYDFAAGVIRLRPGKAKTKRPRVIPASEELRTWISTHADPAGRLVGAALFRNPLGRSAAKRWTLDAMEDTWRVAGKIAGVDVPLYSGTKHSSATAARRAGVALEEIQEALGHVDRGSTERYARAADLAPVGVLQQLVPRLSFAKKSQEPA